MERKLEILLYQLVNGSGLIIPYPSGIIYTNQTAGMSCCQTSLEGIFIPMALGSPAEKDSPVAVAADVLGIFYPNDRDEQSDREAMDRIDAVLTERGYGYLKVDRARWGKSHEAWLWLTIGGEFPYLDWYAGRGGRQGDESERKGPEVTEAVLTWENSD